MYALRNRVFLPSSRRGVISRNPRSFHSSRPILSNSSSEAASFVNQVSDSSQKANNGQQPEISLSSNGKTTRFVSVDKRSNSRFQKHITIKLGEEIFQLDPLWLRDSCSGPCCIDQSTTQKLFQTTDIPRDLKVAQAVNLPGGGIQITWMNDLPHYNDQNEHISVYDDTFFKHQISTENRYQYDFFYGDSKPWSGYELDMIRIPYETFMETDRDLYKVLRGLVCDGIIMIKGVPLNEDSVELIAKRIGNLRDTFYGRTWNVKSVPKAKNVAYTSVHLGLHMDLLYMMDPPGLQLLHCLKNTCEGGTAIFSDTFRAAEDLSVQDIKTLRKEKTAYHYHNDNEHYFQEHPTLEYTSSAKPPILKYVNWSPPFQTSYKLNNIFGYQLKSDLTKCNRAMKAFAERIEEPENIYRYDYEEGDCVIFNNRRVVHGREAFNAEGGERWLKGAYVDTGVFHSRLRVLREKLSTEEGTP